MSTYRRLDRIGRGGMGDVYEAERILKEGTPDRVACKTMRDELHADPKYLDMFFREARLSLKICHNHPGLVTVYECIEDTEGRSHLIMELVEGCSLHSICNANGVLPWDILRLVAQDVLRTLAYVHEKDIVHRDISPCNILVSCEGDIKLSDLGLAKLANTAHSDPRRFHGKWPYASPEAIRRERVDARSDLFSFAAVMYELITTRCVYGNAESYAHVESKLDKWRPPTLTEDVPPDLRALMTTLLQADPNARLPAATQALLLLRAVDADAARHQLAHMARTIYERRKAQRQRRRAESAKLDRPEIIIESRVHIDPHADTDEDTRQFESGEHKSTVSLDPPIEQHLSLPPLPAPRRRRGVIMPALVLCLLGWLAYDRYDDDPTPREPVSIASTPTEQASAEATESTTTSAENESTTAQPSTAKPQTASVDTSEPTRTASSPSLAQTTPTSGHEPRVHRRHAKKQPRQIATRRTPKHEPTTDARVNEAPPEPMSVLRRGRKLDP